MAETLNSTFTDEAAARKWLEQVRRSNGAFCPHCGEAEKVTRLRGEAHREMLVKRSIFSSSLNERSWACFICFGVSSEGRSCMSEIPKNPALRMPYVQPRRFRASTIIIMPIITDSLPYHLGMVAVMHGQLERIFRAFYNACESAHPEEKDKQAYRYGIKRLSNAAKGKCEKIFSDHPDISECLSIICKQVKAFELRRNITLHGNFVATFPKGGEITLSVIGEVDKQETCVDFTEDDVVQLWHDIICITGHLHMLFEQVDHPLLTFEQKQIVQDRLQQHYRLQATLPTHPRRPLTSVW